MWPIISYFLSLLGLESTEEKPAKKPTIAIIGCGLSGLCAAIRVKEELGVDAQIYEKMGDVGGVWVANQYPGCAVDVPSHLYTYSFAPNPNWTHLWSLQPDILDYLQKVAQKYGIYQQTLFNTHVFRVTWISTKNQWKVEYRQGTTNHVQTRFYDFLFMAVGPLHELKIPQEFNAFKGPIVHTARWDKSLDFTAKKVAVIGNGASAIQLIPHLQKVASKLISYQRSNAWVIPVAQLKFPTWLQKLFAFVPLLLQFSKWLLFMIFEPWYPIFLKDYESRGAKWFVRYGEKCMRSSLALHGREDLAKILIPDYPVVCKGLSFSTDYLPAICQTNVEVKMGQIKNIQERTIFHSDGSAEDVDILVLATGFDTKTFFPNVQVVGQDDVCLNETWKRDYPSTFQCIHIHTCPNMFVLLGPNSFPFQSATTMIEGEVNNAVRAMKFVLKNNLGALEARKESQDIWTQKIRKELKAKTVFSGTCTSWWKNEEGEVLHFFSGGFLYFWWVTRWPDYAKDFLSYPHQQL